MRNQFNNNTVVSSFIPYYNYLLYIVSITDRILILNDTAFRELYYLWDLKNAQYNTFNKKSKQIIDSMQNFMVDNYFIFS